MNYEERINKMYESQTTQKEGVISDYVLFEGLKRLFNVPKLSFAHFLIIKLEIVNLLKKLRY
jgi:hypothetical protein